MDSGHQPQDDCALVHHGAEHAVSGGRADVVVERATWSLDWDQRAKAVGVVSGRYLEVAMILKIFLVFERFFSFFSAQGFLWLVSAF